IAKTTFGGYDGKGQFTLESKEDVDDLVAKMFGPSRNKDQKPPAELILEEKIDLHLEVSCIVGRSKNGAEVVFPIFENEHKDHILDVTILPARLP
ncbi:ATP-grasp domain-containing protein, partial [Glaesserella parasuis]|uniref:ATP-grasp domain-containing protein n=1 Tax=Glaesserella parasuis TaxID=738 RepID=UPI003F3DEF44